MKIYRPPAGSTAAHVVEHLTKHGGTLNAAQIASKWKVAAQSVSTVLRKAVAARILRAERVGQGFQWGLVAASIGERAATEPLQIANYNDGDVVIRGHTENQDGSITYSRDQIQQLITHVTTPHLQLPASQGGANV